MKINKFFANGLLIIFGVLGITSCKPIQDLSGDIVFSEIDTAKSVLTSYSFEDNSVQQYQLGYSFISPIYFKDSDIVIGLSPLHGDMGGNPAYINLSTGRMNKCKSSSFYSSIIKDPRSGSNYEVIVTGAMMINGFDLKKCEIKEIFYELPESDPDKKMGIIVGSSMSADGSNLFFSKGNYDGRAEPAYYSIMKMNTSTGETVEIEQGIYPSLSHDNQMLAFIKENSLALLDLETGDIKIAHNFKGVVSSFGLSIDWSPDDSQLLVQVIDDSDDSFFEGSMYVYDLETEEFSRVNEKGVYPSWIN